MRVLLVMEGPTAGNVSTTLMPPLGILSVASYLESRGMACDVVDRTVDRREVDWARYQAVGFSVNVSNVSTTKREIARLRRERRSLVIMAGGPYCMIDPEAMLAAGADVAVIGEGEHTAYEFLSGQDPLSVPGLCLPGENGPVRTSDRAWETDLDQFPVAALNKVDLARYNASLRQALPISSIFTSRGCPYNCIFCFHTMGHRFRARSPQHVADEIEWQVRELGAREICIEDDCFTYDVERAIEVCREISRRALPVRLQLRSGVRVDRLTQELCHALKEAGCWLVSISPETGTDEGLSRINKRFAMSDVRRAVSYLRRARLSTLACFMVGFPWERNEDVGQTIAQALALDVDFLQVTRVRSFPGTKLYDMAEFGPDDGVADCPGFFQGDLQHQSQLQGDELSRLIKQFYRRFYLRPRIVWGMARTLPVSALWDLARYALITRNV